MSSDTNGSEGDGGNAGNGGNDSNNGRDGGNNAGGSDGDDSNNGSSGGGNGSDGESSSPSTAEKVFTVVSVLFTVLLFAFLVWQALQVPASTSPQAHVENVEQLPDDRIGVTVVLTNPASEGLLSATVAVDCDQPSPSIEFTHVPTDGRQTATLVCPAGTESNATANVTAWQTA